RMVELYELKDPGDERLHLFIELARKHGAALKGDDRAKCLYHQAHCLRDLHDAEATALLKTVCQEHAGSEWARRATMWLAFDAHCAGRHEEARKAYLALVRECPDHRCGAIARKWAPLLDQREKVLQELDQVVAELGKRLMAPKRGVAWSFE